LKLERKVKVKSRWTLIIGIVLSLALVGGLALSCAAPAPEVPAEVGALQKALAAKEAELAKLQSTSKADLANLEKAKAAEIAKLKGDISSLNEEIAELKAPAKPAKQIVLKLQVYQPPQHMIATSNHKIAPEFEKMTDGRAKIEVYDSQTLAKVTEFLEVTQRGVIDITSPSLPRHAGPAPLLDWAGGVPFIWRNAPGMINAIEYGLDELTNEAVLAAGFDKVLTMGAYYVGAYQLGFKGAEVKVPDDLKGLTVNATGAVLAKYIEACGGSTVAMPTSEVYDALERGIADGAFGVWSNWRDWGWLEPADYLLECPITTYALAFFINTDSLAKLEEEDQESLLTWIRYAQACLSRDYMMADTIASAEVAKGMTFYTPTSEEFALWQEKAQPLIQEWIEKSGEFGPRAMEIIEKYNVW